MLINALVGRNPDLVTEYMPDSSMLVINRGTDRVYLSTDSNISPGSAIPCEASASVEWSTAGTLYAMLDPAAVASSAPLLVTDLISSWEQSPIVLGLLIAEKIAASQLASLIGAAVPSASAIGTATGAAVPVPPSAGAIGAAVPSASAIGGQVAQQANALGIPATYFGAVAYDANLTGSSGIPIVIPFDFSGSASVAIYITGITNACLVTYEWTDTITGKAYVSRQIQASAAGSKIQFSSSVRSPTLQITLSSINGVTPPRIRVYVSNHTIPADSVSGDLSYTAGPFQITAAGATNMPGNFLSKGGSISYRSEWNTSYDTTTTKSRMGWKAYYPDGSSVTQWFIDGTFNTIVGTVSRQTGTVQVPPGSLQMVFTAAALGTGSIFLDLWSGAA